MERLRRTREQVAFQPATALQLTNLDNDLKSSARTIIAHRGGEPAQTSGIEPKTRADHCTTKAMQQSVSSGRDGML
jgi:hypothetical protein